MNNDKINNENLNQPGKSPDTDTIYDILAANLSGETLSAEEINSLEEWKEAHPENQKIYEQFRALMERNSGITRGENKKHLFEQIQQKIAVQKTKLRNRKYLTWLSSAASVLIILGMIYYYDNTPQVTTPPLPLAQQIKPGEPKAQLKLSTGEVIELNARQQEAIVVDSSLQIKNEAHTLIYNPEKSPSQEMTYNTLSVPLGAEYKLILSDGTKVYLNSGSALRYPTGFSGAKRDVYLTGEAYFEVTKDSLRTFVVHTKQMAITVRGTSFNVKAYPSEEHIAATLEEGKIQVTCNGKDYNIIPGNQITYNTIDRQTEIKEVDTELYTSWKSGYYKFEKMSLEEIMSTLALWYDLQVFYMQPEVKDIVFTGRLKKYENVENLLKKFEQTNEVEFIIKERSVTIKKK